MAPGASSVADDHFAYPRRNAGAVNYPDAFIFNLEEGDKDTGAFLKLSAKESGAFTVTNGRTKVTKSYK